MKMKMVKRNIGNGSTSSLSTVEAGKEITLFLIESWFLVLVRIKRGRGIASNRPEKDYVP